MGSAGNKRRKPKQRLAKVPKYEESNGLVGMSGSGGGFGRSGHGADHHSHSDKPGRAGTFLLRVLGKRPKE